MKKYHFDYQIILCIIFFIFVSIISIYNAEKLLLNINYYYIKQLIWYSVGIVFILIIIKLGNNFIYKYATPFYIITNVLLLLLLFFASPINEAKCWFEIKGIGTIQPSEFAKIAIILMNAKLINDYKTNYPNPSILDEFKFLLKIIIYLIPPSVLTFLEPDTGVVIIYFLITIIMLFASGIRYRWFIFLGIFLISVLGIILFIYFKYENLFIKIFGNSFFLRINRLLDWSNSSGYQLENSLISIGSGGFLGHRDLELYFPEPQTDFIFAVFSSSFGLLGSLILLFALCFFDIKLIRIASKCKNKMDKYIISGIVGMLIYQQFQNIGMTYGIMPITGITLPFISYGGSSLISYMIIIGIIFNVINDNFKFRN